MRTSGRPGRGDDCFVASAHWQGRGHVRGPTSSVALAVACFIKPLHVDPRFGLGVGALFAAVANSYVVNSLVPDNGEFCLADVVNGLGIFTILITLIESTISLYLFDECGEEDLSRRPDRMLFKIVVVGFTLVNGLLLATAAL